MTIWTNFRLGDDLALQLSKRLSPHNLLQSANANSSNLTPGTTDNDCQRADVAFGQPSVEDLLASNSLRFVQLTTAGYTRYDRRDLAAALQAREAALCTASAVYDDPCAQHVLSFMLAHNRCLMQAQTDQNTTRGWHYKALRPAVRTLGGENVLIVGFGAIGQRLVELLAPFRSVIRGVRRSVSGKEPIPTFGMSTLSGHLPWADHVINLLPSSPANRKIFNSEMFVRMKPGAAFYNVGRGDTVDQESLVEALESNHLGGAYLDVTDPEPLPPEHLLWRAPRCLITPHVAGGTQGEIQKLVDHFLGNFERFQNGNELMNRVI